MTRLALALALFCLPTHLMANPPQTLEAHRWKHRLLVIPQASGERLAELQKHHADLQERHVTTIVLTANTPQPIHREIASRFRLTATDNDILLIGKDGRTTVRWKPDQFTFTKLFQQIDAMPMRQREIKNK